MKKIRFLLLTLVALVAGVNSSWADTWTVAGSSDNVLGSAWEPTETSNDMTQVDGTTLWYLTKQSVALTADNITFKVCKDHSWDTAYPESDRTLTVDAAGTYDVTFWYNSNDNSVYATYVFSIQGNLWDDWATDKDMVQDSENPFVYTLTIDEFAAEAKTYEYKLHANHAWADYQLPGSGNNTWTPTEAGNYTLVFTANVTTHTLELTATKIEEPASGYTCDFNTAISTSDHAFQVASNWRHIVDTYEDYYSGNTTYASYSYSTTAGVDGSGALSCGTNQSNNSIYDLLVTPVVKGTVTIAAKTTASYYTPQLTFYKITDNGDGTFTRGTQITVDVSAINATDYTTITIPVDEAGERIGIRSSYVWLDNFSATEATIIPEAKMTIASAVPSATTGTIYWEQQANGKVLVSYTVTVTNTGEVDLMQGDEGFSVSIINGSTGDVYATVAVPQNLAVGETSDEFVVSAEVETSLWPNSYTYINMNLKENLFGSTVQRAQSHYKAYESKFVFREAGSTSTSSISSAQNWGTITESTSKNFEVANTGTAPLTITAYTAPTGFTLTPGFVLTDPTTWPEGVSLSGTSVVMQGGAVVPFTVTQDASTIGTYSGTLAITYKDYGAENTTNYTLDFSATVIGANTWTADFNNTTSTAVYPQGSVKEGGISTDWDNKTSDGKYNIYLKGIANQASYQTENNKFITPKLHANAGDQLAFDVKAGYSSSDDYFVKVYVSADRVNWGEPVQTYVYSTVGSSFTTKTVSFDTAGDYYVAFAIYGTGSGIDNLVGLEKVDVAHDLYIKSVSWPHEDGKSVKSATALSKPSVDIIPLTNEVAANYTVKYFYGENVVEIASKDLTASASSTTSFAASFTPEVTTTTTFPGTKVVFEFTDGTKFETETFDLTVTNEPIFHFQNAKYTSRWYEPTSDYSTPYNFGKTNVAGASKTFWILNWGSAPLTVKSITVPEGFTTSVSEMSLPAFDGTQDGLETCQQSFDVTFSATEAGTYSGNLVVTYVNGAGEDATYELALSGTMLDPTKWYANFNDQQWPAGSVYQDNVSISYINTGDYGLLSSSSSKNFFITPKLTAAAGDVLQFDASTRNNYYDGTVKVYVAADRENLGNPVKEIELSKTDNVSKSTYDYTFTTAGDFYVAFALEEARVDDIYGLTLTDVAHDWMIASSNIPTEAMQNVASTATVNILNLGLADEAADSYIVTAYVNDEAVGTGTAVAIPMNHKLSDAGTQISVNFISSIVGTFPVYVEVKAGDYSVATQSVDVTFAEEEVKSDATADADGVSTNVPLTLSYYNSESVSLYTATVLEGSYGLTPGARIKSITYKGFKTGDEHTSTLNVWYEWVDETAQANPANGLYNTEGMTQIIANQTQTWEKKGSASQLEDFITLNFSEPLVYQGKALRIVVRSNSAAWKSVSFEKSKNTTSGLAYYHYNDTESTFNTNSWSSSVLPVLHMTLDASAATLAGTVKTSAGAGIEGATITLKAENGVEYSGTTDAEGNYSINVIQAGLDFTATVEAAGYLKRQFALNMNGASATSDVTMYTQFGLVGTLPGLSQTTDAIMQPTDDPNIFTLEINNVEVTAGDGYTYKLRADGAWDNELAGQGYELPQSGDYTWNFATSGTYNFKFTFDWTNHTLTFERPFTLSENNTADIADLNWVDITIDREFKAGWNAVVLPFALSAEEVTATFGANCELAVFKGDTNDNGNVTVNFESLAGEYKYMSAGYPYMLWLENPVSGLKFTKNIVAEQNNAIGTTFDFVGVYKQTNNQAGDYIVQGGEFRKASASNFVRPFRAYLKLKDGQTARSLTFVVGNEEVTAIEGLSVERNYSNDAIYNLNGQKLQQPTKRGLYIINGKKVMVK